MNDFEFQLQSLRISLEEMQRQLENDRYLEKYENLTEAVRLHSVCWNLEPSDYNCSNWEEVANALRNQYPGFCNDFEQVYCLA